jgi:CRP/FNR family cyclic AMP-dependent transcriptional regulator
VDHELTSLFKDLLLSHSDVSRLTALRRTTCLFGQGDKADALYFVEKGLIKVTRTHASAGKLILSIHGPNDLLGEESLSGGAHRYPGEAEVLSPATIYKIPWATIELVRSAHPELGVAFIRCLLDLNDRFVHKVELLSLHDVETRILYHLEQLAKLVEAAEEDSGYRLPITQLELADLVGATRETTSTTLNQLERRGFVKLSRRLLTVYLPQSRAASASGDNGNS